MYAFLLPLHIYLSISVCLSMHMYMSLDMGYAGRVGMPSRLSICVICCLGGKFFWVLFLLFLYEFCS